MRALLRMRQLKCNGVGTRWRTPLERGDVGRTDQAHHMAWHPAIPIHPPPNLRYPMGRNTCLSVGY